LLGCLLFAAGLGVQTERATYLLKRPLPLLFGVLASLALPIVFVLVAAMLLQNWHNPREAQEILVGLSLVAALPIAGSSTAWTQSVEGDAALSIGLVVCSTCLSPFSTPLVLNLAGWALEGEYADALHRLAQGEASGVLGLYVLAPSLAGIAVRALFGGERIARLRPCIRLSSATALLVLCYANAAVALPQALREPDWNFLGLTLLVVAGMCVASFAAGAVVGHPAGADRAERASLIFGLGMTNNGTGLVLAAGLLPHAPMVMVPIIVYNLVQHVAAACVGHFWGSEDGKVVHPLPVLRPRRSHQPVPV